MEGVNSYHLHFILENEKRLAKIDSAIFWSFSVIRDAFVAVS